MPTTSSARSTSRASTWRLRWLERSRPRAIAASTVGDVAGNPSAPSPADSTSVGGSRSARRLRRAAAASGDRHWFAVQTTRITRRPRDATTGPTFRGRARCARGSVFVRSSSRRGRRATREWALHARRPVDAPALGDVDRHVYPVGVERGLVTHDHVVPAVVQHHGAGKSRDRAPRCSSRACRRRPSTRCGRAPYPARRTLPSRSSWPTRSATASRATRTSGSLRRRSADRTARSRSAGVPRRARCCRG